jgi:hypothetical protein
VWQPIGLDFVTQQAGSTLDLQVLDAPVILGDVFEVDDLSVRVVP